MKKWIIPLTAMIVGISIGFSFFPSSQDHHYNQLMTLINEQASRHFEMEGTYFFNEDKALSAEGYWSEELTMFRVTTPVSDDSSFIFDIYIEEDQFYVESNGDWTQASKPHSVIDQMAPLDDPFTWAKGFLENADQLVYTKEASEKTYTGIFDHMENADFMGYRLEKQNDSHLSFVFDEDVLKKMHISIEPIRPDDIGIFERYPELLEYELSFLETEKVMPDIPQKAREAEPLD